MKKILVLAICTFVAFNLKAQSTTDEIQLLQTMYGMEKKQLVVEYMKFQEEESIKFWPIYDKYEEARKALGQKRIDNILAYAKNYQNMTDEKATELVTSSLAIHESFTKLQEKTFKELSKAIAPLRAAQFIQFEVFLENAIRSEINAEIPFITKK